MTFSTLMVHLNVDPSADACLTAALDLVQHFDAKVVGVAAATLPWSFYSQEVTPRQIDELNEIISQRLADAEQRFRRAAMQQHLQRIDWRSEIASPAAYLSLQARAADLIILGRNLDGLVPDSFQGHVDPGDLVMQVGRPVLVIPPQVGKINLKCAMIAWKDTREARRAVSDALPLLRKVQEVVVVEVIEEESDRSAAHGRLDDVVSWLAGHGIPSVARVFDFPGNKDPMAKLYQYGADFIVAGGYGHAQAREWVFGGFTRDLLKRSPQCVFLSH
jgi:nucleotide-binding universal stress UspA family protein